MFHFPAFPPTPYEFGMQVTRHDSRQVTPFGHPGITARLTAPPGLSQPPTSFIGPWYQGIHRPPLPTYPTHKNFTYLQTNHRTPKDTRVHYANLNPPPTHHQQPPHPGQPPAMPGQDNNPPTQQVHDPPGRTVVPSEPQQGVHRPTDPHRRTVPTTPRGDGCTRCAGRQPAGLASVSDHEQPRPDIRGPRASLTNPLCRGRGDAP
jgi:hypothetical protein